LRALSAGAQKAPYNHPLDGGTCLLTSPDKESVTREFEERKKTAPDREAES